VPAAPPTHFDSAMAGKNDAAGAVRRLAENEDPNALKAMITRAGGENVNPKSDPIRPVP